MKDKTNKFKEAKDNRREDQLRELKKEELRELKGKQKEKDHEREQALRTVGRRGSVTGALQCFKETSAKIYVHLPPSYLKNIPGGIDTQLNKFLLRFVSLDFIHCIFAIG